MKNQPSSKINSIYVRKKETQVKNYRSILKKTQVRKQKKYVQKYPQVRKQQKL
jgi:hypothetical protein